MKLEALNLSQGSLVVHSIPCSQELIKESGMYLKRFKYNYFPANFAGGTER